MSRALEFPFDLGTPPQLPQLRRSLVEQPYAPRRRLDRDGDTRPLETPCDTEAPRRVHDRGACGGIDSRISKASRPQCFRVAGVRKKRSITDTVSSQVSVSS